MKRGGDLAVTVLAGIIAVPLGLLIALLIRATTGGPVIFRQTRTGRHGREFAILKFRTMRDKRHEDEPDAPRITRLGALLRKTSLDELPQLWNVLRGDMGVIGPRPTLPEQVVHYSDRQRGRLAVRPGLTGWAQVRGRNSITWPERIELDLWYIEHHSLTLDLRILALTVKVLLRPAGITAAGGVNPGFPAPAHSPAPSPAPAEPAAARIVLPRQATATAPRLAREELRG
ncbi:sugar transferase [Kitasatospora cineracea]|uniref:Lipopolysaccharide/colanic/teichoic acid biosynthesis glycosyltransferase n=1 Tax=Kitasatospora cineracea TaxID=88074 RepID=A0A3N4RS26_9ACTN|nr:sugar transferase [Kitasatospora cineracea]RPE35676.1 lipopolysaccharide/colanic/teichoic acid biosynthesis glycosyltransferase [Kitasatospora cineracea]